MLCFSFRIEKQEQSQYGSHQMVGPVTDQNELKMAILLFMTVSIHFLRTLLTL